MQRHAVDRLACVSVRALPFQLLLRRHPDWAAHPVAVVAEDKPQGLILWVNEKARQAGVLPGLRYAAGLSLTPDLRAGVLPTAEIEDGVLALTERLTRFSPEVEPSSEEPGVFWLGASGLNLLYPSLKEWARSIQSDLEDAGFRATVVVGFTRFGAYAVAKACQGTAVFDDFSREREAAWRVPLDRLNLDPDFRDTLSKLGVKSVGALLSLPAGGVLERFGPEAARLYRMASGELSTPLQPCQVPEPLRQTLALDDPETDLTRFCFLFKRLLHPLLEALAIRGEALAELTLRLRLDGAGWREEQIRPAAPTLDVVQLLDLVRLRLEAGECSSGIAEIELTAEGSPATREQLRFFVREPRRDLDAANRALARLRAEFGDGAVVRARLQDEHLPEAGFAWEPLAAVTSPKPKEEALRTLVRRILARPILWAPGAATRFYGPYIVSGGWWMREVYREYSFAETRAGECVWVYYDPNRRQWFFHGRVE